LHAAQSLALYEGLSELPEGRRRIIENLTLAEPARDPEQRFAQTWPELVDDPARLARVWALAVARLSTPKKLEFLGAEDTGKKLRQILRELDSSVEGEPSPEVLLALSRKEQGQFRLAGAAQEIQRLSFRSHPLYAPVVGEYFTLIDDLSRKRRRGFADRFQDVQDLRASLDERSRDIADYINWYQANEAQSEPASDVVTRLPPTEPAARRNDAISRYLDSVEQRGW
jgi:hypothetical protein